MVWVANTAEAAALWVAETAEASVSWLAETAEGKDSVCVVGGGDSVGNGIVAWVANTAEATASWVAETAEASAAKSDNLMIVCCKGSKKNGAKASKQAVTSGQEPVRFYPPTQCHQFPNGFAPSLGGKPSKDSWYSGMISQRYIRLDYRRKTPWWGSSFKREEAAK